MTDALAPLDPADIVEIAVYPPLGIARVGDAQGQDDYVLASEVVGGMAAQPADLRDAAGRIKRQAVRFRLYARLKTGHVREVTLDDGAQIEWRVTVANLKGGWYAFTNAFDLPAGTTIEADPRNADVGTGRFRLDITPPPRKISGRGLSGAEYTLEGRFFARPVYLGELRTDAQGRLLFLGGRGTSAPRWEGTRPTTFANNSLWFDDVSDGPVRASVSLGGRTFEATPGYVAVGPPNYAPGLFSAVTMDDVVQDLFLAQGWAKPAASLSFTRDIWPIFSRLTGLQWVNHGLFMLHGFGSSLDADQSQIQAKLRDASAAGLAWRTAVMGLFRDPAVAGSLDRAKVPYLYGDSYGDLKDDARGMLAVTPTMYRSLQQWARGDFTDDWSGPPPVPSFESLSAEEQLQQLCRAPLYECLGGPFHPGIELTWIMRRPTLWSAPYRLKILPEERAYAQQHYGPKLNAANCLAPGGPVDGVAAGSLTRWLGVPWQTDEASCQSDAEYSPSTYLSMPSYWGARVPNQVLSAEAWSRVADPDSPALQRLKHAAYREGWTRDINGVDYYDRIHKMVREWSKLGMVLPRDTPQALRDLGLPPTTHVESGRDPLYAGSNDKLALMARVEVFQAPVLPAEAAAGAQPLAEASPPLRTYGRGQV